MINKYSDWNMRHSSGNMKNSNIVCYPSVVNLLLYPKNYAHSYVSVNFIQIPFWNVSLAL